MPEAPSPALAIATIGEARRDMYRQQIIAAAEVEFAKSGFEKTRVGDIAGTAGVALGTLYKYFSGKDDIWDALNQQRMEDFTTIGLAAVSDSQSPLEQLFAMLRAQVTYFVAHPGFLQVHAREGLSWGTAGTEVGRGSQREVWRAGMEVMNGFARDLVASGQVPPLKPQVIAGLVVSSLQVWLTDWLDAGCVESADVLADQLIEHLRRSFTVAGSNS